MNNRFRPTFLALEARDVPAGFSFTLPDGSFASGTFSTPLGVDPAQAVQALPVTDLMVSLNGTPYLVQPGATADFASGVLLGVTATATGPSGGIVLTDGTVTVGGYVAPVVYVADPPPLGTGTSSVSVQGVPASTDEGLIERLRVTRVGDISQASTVAFTINPNGSTAVAGTDYSLQGDGVTFAPGTLSGTITFEAGSAVADIFVVPATQTVAPVLLTIQPGAGYVVGAGASVPVNLNMAVPSSTIDFATIRTDITYTIEIRAVTTQPGGFGVLIQPLIGTVTVKIGDKTDDIRDRIDTILENAGYTTKPRAGSKLRVYGANNLQGLQFTFKDPKTATGEVPPDGVKPPTLIEGLGLPIEYNGQKLKVPTPM